MPAQEEECVEVHHEQQVLHVVAARPQVQHRHCRGDERQEQEHHLRDVFEQRAAEDSLVRDDPAARVAQPRLVLLEHRPALELQALLAARVRDQLARCRAFLGRGRRQARLELGAQVLLGLGRARASRAAPSGVASRRPAASAQARPGVCGRRPRVPRVTAACVAAPEARGVRPVAAPPSRSRMFAPSSSTCSATSLARVVDRRQEEEHHAQHEVHAERRRVARASPAQELLGEQARPERERPQRAPHPGVRVRAGRRPRP